MAFQRPTLAELVDRIQNDFVGRLQGVGAVLSQSLIFVFVRVVAGAAHMLYGYLEYLSKQLFPDRSDREFLIRQARPYGVTPNDPTFAHSTILVSGDDDVVIPAETIFTRSDGAQYVTDDEQTTVAGEATCAVTAVLAGLAGLLEVGVAVTMESPILGLNATAVCVSKEADGTDEEDTEDFRTRFSLVLQEPSHEGTAPDYVRWAREVPGVTRAWCVPQGLGPGTVLVWFARDDDGSPVPDAGEVAVVQAYIDERAPAHAIVTVSAISLYVQNYTLHIVPDNSDTRAAVTAELVDVNLRYGEPAGTVPISKIRTAIDTAAGVTDYTLATPSADVVAGPGEIPSVGTVTFT